MRVIFQTLSEPGTGGTAFSVIIYITFHTLKENAYYSSHIKKSFVKNLGLISTLKLRIPFFLHVFYVLILFFIHLNVELFINRFR